MSQIRTINSEGGAGGVELLRLNGQGAGQRGMMCVTRANDAGHVYERFTQVETEVVRELYKPREGLELVPTEADISDGTKKVKFYTITAGGKAEVVEGIEPRINKVDVGGSPVEDDIYRLAVGFDVDVDELAGSSMQSDPWNRVMELSMTCQEVLYEGLDRVILHGDEGKVRKLLVGDDKSGIQGAGGGLKLDITSASDADELVDQLMKVLDEVYEQAKKAIMPNRLGLSLRWRNLLSRKRLSGTGQSVLSYIAENSPYLGSVNDIVGVSAFEDYFGAKGSKAARDAIMPYHYDRRTVRAKIQTPRARTIKQMTYGQTVIWDARCTPAQWKRPLGARVYSAQYAS